MAALSRHGRRGALVGEGLEAQNDEKINGLVLGLAWERLGFWEVIFIVFFFLNVFN